MVIDYTAVGQNVLLGVAALLGLAVLRNRILRTRELNSKLHLRDAQRRRALCAPPVVADRAELEPDAADPEYIAFQLQIAERKRHMQQATEAKKQMDSFLLAMVKKLHRQADALPLTEEQRRDFDYHMQCFNADGYTKQMPPQCLAALAAACQAIGVSLETIGG